MPKIFGVSVLGIFAAAIVFYIWGFLFFAVFFDSQWMTLNGITEAAATARLKSFGPLFHLYGFAIPLAQAFGLAFIFNQTGSNKLGDCVKLSVIITTLIVLPILFMSWLYNGRDLGAIWLDFGYLLIGFILAAAALSIFRGKD